MVLDIGVDPPPPPIHVHYNHVFFIEVSPMQCVGVMKGGFLAEWMLRSFKSHAFLLVQK